MQVIDFLWSEREWLFSGVGVVLLAWLFSKFWRPDRDARAASPQRHQSNPPLGSNQLDPLFVRLSDGHSYQVQILFSYRLVDPMKLMKNADSFEKAEEMLQNSLRVKAAGKLEGHTYSSLASDRSKVAKSLLELMKSTAAEFGMEMLELDIGSISKVDLRDRTAVESE